MNTTPTIQSRRPGLRLVSHARAWLAVSALAALAAASQSLAQSIAFSDPLTGPSSPNLTIPAEYSYTALGLQRSGNAVYRSLVETVSGAHLTATQFTADVAVNVALGDIAFVGLGQGTTNPNYGPNEPTNSFVFRIHNLGNYQQIDTAVAAGLSSNQFVQIGGIGSYAGGSTTVFRIARSGDSVTLSVPAQGISHTYSLAQYGGTMGLTTANTRFFFGSGNTGTRFSNLSITVSTPSTNWVNWTGSELAGGITKYVGQIVVPRTGGGSTTVTVKYTPPNQSTDYNSPNTPGIAFIQTSGSTDYFAQGIFGSLGRNPAKSPYTSSKVTSIPDGGGGANDKGDIIALRYAGTNTLEFTDSSGSPISIASPVFAYVSLNGNGYGFNQDFDILSFGDGTVRDIGYWGGGTSSKSTAVAGQYRLLGTGEPHGTLQFRGSFSTVTWQSLSNEFWNGFTIGVAQLADDVPIANAGLDQTVNATSPSGATVNLSGSASGSTKTPFTFTWSGAFGTVTGQNPTVTLPVGTHTVTLNVRDTAGSTDSDTVVITVLPNPAPVINSPANANGTYGAPFSYTITATNSPSSFGATNLPAGLTLSGAVISGTPTATGLFGVNLSAQNSGGTGTKTLLLNIAKANATVVVTPYNVTYDGNPHTATFTLTGVNGDTGAAVGTVTLNSTHTAAGTYSDSWSFTGSINYNNIGSTPITDTITKATAAIVVTPYSVTYDGNAHTATGSATGVKGESLSGLSLAATTHTNAGTTTDAWTFTDATGNYNNASGSVVDAIAKADATVTVNGYTGTYDAAAHGATGSATGVGGAALGGLNLGASFTDAPGGTANWSFVGGANYNDTSGSAAIVINKADATIAVNGYTGIYDAAAHGATGSAAGVGGVDLSSGLTLGSSFTDAPGGTANWSFAGGINYKDTSGTAAIVISKADATIAVNGYTGIYDAAAHGATGSATGVGGVALPGLNLGASFTNVPGGTASWSFAGGTNYNNASGSVPITLSKATANINVSGYTGIYDGAAHGATGSATGVGGVNLGGSLALGATFKDVPGGTANWSFTGGTNYHNASGSVAIVINKANATVVVTPYTVEYDAQPHSATVTSITGVNGESGATVGTVTLNSTHTNVGIYADSWSFAGANYNSLAGALTDTIKDTTAPVITSASSNAPTLWPPNHKMVAVTVSATASDLVGVTSLKIISATSSEPDNGLGDGDTAGDIVITGNLTLNLRAERSGSGNGRTYTIVVEARDAAGNASTRTVTVSVPKSQGK